MQTSPVKIYFADSGYKFCINTRRDYFIGVFAATKSIIRFIISAPESAEIFHDIELIVVVFLFTTLVTVFTLTLYG